MILGVIKWLLWVVCLTVAVGVARNSYGDQTWIALVYLGVVIWITARPLVRWVKRRRTVAAAKYYDREPTAAARFGSAMAALFVFGGGLVCLLGAAAAFKDEIGDPEKKAKRL